LEELSDGYLLNVTKIEQSFAGFGLASSNTVILVRLSPLGAVIWARSYTGIDTFTPPTVHNTREGMVFLRGLEMLPDVGQDAAQNAILVCLNAQGAKRWAKRIAQANIGNIWPLSDDRFFISGSMMSADGQNAESLFGILDSNGNVQKQILVSTGDLTFGFAVLGKDQLLYTLLASEMTPMGIDVSQTAVIGTSDLELDQWHWRQRAQPVFTATLMLGDNGTDLLFSSFDNEDHSFDLINLDADLTSNAPCELFVNADVIITDANLTSSEFSVDIADVNVTAGNDTPTFGPGHIALQTFNCLETSICQ